MGCQKEVTVGSEPAMNLAIPARYNLHQPSQAKRHAVYLQFF
jgi:hypothetical protein